MFDARSMFALFTAFTLGCSASPQEDDLGQDDGESASALGSADSSPKYSYYGDNGIAGACARALTNETSSPRCRYNPGGPGCAYRPYVTCEDGTKLGPFPAYYPWSPIAANCQSHCVDGTERVRWIAEGNLDVRRSSHQHGTCPYGTPGSGSGKAKVRIEILGPATSPFVTWDGSRAVRPLDNDGKFTFGDLSGEVSGARDASGRFVLDSPATVTITAFHVYSNFGSGGTCGASADLAQPSTLPLTESSVSLR